MKGVGLGDLLLGGQRNVGDADGRVLALTETMRALLDADTEFERTSEPEICLVTYRFVPSAWKRQLPQAAANGNSATVSELNARLNEVNIELQKRQRDAGKGFVSRMMLESAGYAEDGWRQNGSHIVGGC